MASRISRKGWSLGRPGARGCGRWGSMTSHSSSERSLWYALLMVPGILPGHRLKTPFQTVSGRSTFFSRMLTCERRRLTPGDAQRRGTALQLDHAGDAAKLSRLSEVASGVASERTPDTLGRALEALREELGMEVAFVSEFDRQRMVFRRLVGDGGSFGWQEGGSIPLDDTYCRLLTEGHLPPIVPDAGANGRVRGLDVTGEAGIGSYVGVPIRFSDGTLYGTLCCVSHEPDPSLQERDAQFVAVLARLVADQIEHGRSRRREAEARVRAHERRVISRELHDRVAHAMGVVYQSLQLHEALRDRDPE